MNFNFDFNSNFSFSDGSMVIKNGSQVIKMGPYGMEIKNGPQNSIMMSNNGIRVYNNRSNLNVNISSTNGVTVNGRKVPSNTTTRTSNTRNQFQTYNFSNNGFQQSENYEDDDENYNIFGNGSNNMFQNNYNVNYEDEYDSESVGEPEEELNEMDIEEEEEEEKNPGLTIDEIRILPCTKYNVKMMMKNKYAKNGPSCNNSCSICKSDYKLDERLRTLRCIHIFHQKCIDEWLVIKNECPLCKTKALEK